MQSFNIKSTRRTEMIEITEQVRKAIRESKLTSGLCVVYSPHTTAGMTIQENADPDVVHDILLWLNSHIPKEVAGFRHAEGNSDSHIKTSLTGTSVTIIVDGNEPVLGRWQGVYFCEFDGPRTRTVHVQTIGNAG